VIAQAPAVITITTAQMTVALMLSVIALVGSGVAFGRLTERQKGDHQILHDTLETLKKGMAAITTSVDELKEGYQRGREERVEWNYWRVITDERLGEHDEKIGQLEHSHDDVKTRLVVFEDRRKGDPDRRQP
jgi:hypothetical protein